MYGRVGGYDYPSIIEADGRPTATGAEYLSKLDALTGVRRLRLRDGLWAAAEGIIWDDWDPAIHLVDKGFMPHEWPRFWVKLCFVLRSSGQVRQGCTQRTSLVERVA